MGLEHAQTFAANGFPRARVEVIELGQCKVTLRTVRDLEEYLLLKLRQTLLTAVGSSTLTIEEAETTILAAQQDVETENVIGRIVLE